MLLKPELYAGKRCVSVIDLLLVRNLYELGYPEPDPTVSVSFTPEQRHAASKLLSFHRRKQTGAEWDFQYAVLNGHSRTPIITTVDQVRLVAEKVLNKGQKAGCCCMHAYVLALTRHGVPLAGTFAKFWGVWGSHLAAWLPAGDEGQAGVGAAPAGVPGPAVTEQQQQPPQPSSSHGHAEAGCSCHTCSELPSAFQLLSRVTPIPEEPGAYWGWVGGMKEADHFLTAYENETNTSFSVRTSHTRGGEVVQRLNCRAGGEESWLERSKRKGHECTKRPNAVGCSRKGRCSVHITLRIPLGIAQAAGMGLAGQHGNAAAASSPSASIAPPPAPAPPPASPPAPPSASKQLLLELHLQHAGHTPGSKADVAMLPMDPRLRDFIRPMAMQGTPAKFLRPLADGACHQQPGQEDHHQ